VRVITLNDDQALIDYAQAHRGRTAGEHGARGLGFQRHPVPGEDFQRGTIARPSRSRGTGHPPSLRYYGAAVVGGRDLEAAGFQFASTTAARKARSRKRRSWRIFWRASKSGGRSLPRFRFRPDRTLHRARRGTGGSASARVEKAIEPDKFLISAGGFGYLVDATKRALLNHHFEPFRQDIAYDATTNRFIIADYVRLRLVESGRVVFSSKRIALDGIRSLKLEGRLIVGLATTGYEGEESGFTFDLDTLQVKCPVDFSSWDNPPLQIPAPKQAKHWWKFW
jgi:hypothetical protein